MNNVLELNRSSFETALADSSTPILVDFWAPWCGPCRMIAPELEAVATELSGQLRVGKVNVDEEPEIAQQFGVSSIPNLILFREGKPVHQSIGFLDRTQLKKALV